MIDFEGDYQKCSSDIGLTKKKSGKKGKLKEQVFSSPPAKSPHLDLSGNMR